MLNEALLRPLARLNPSIPLTGGHDHVIYQRRDHGALVAASKAFFQGCQKSTQVC